MRNELFKNVNTYCYKLCEEEFTLSLVEGTIHPFSSCKSVIIHYSSGMRQQCQGVNSLAHSCTEFPLEAHYTNPSNSMISCNYNHFALSVDITETIKDSGTINVHFITTSDNIMYFLWYH